MTALAAIVATAAVMVAVAAPAPDGGALDNAVPAAPPSGSAATQNGDLLYVTSQSGPAVTVIDMDARKTVATIRLMELGFTANAKPHHVAVDPDGSHWYVSLIGDGVVLRFDSDNELVGRAPFEAPGLMAIDPERDVLYVGRSMAAVNPPQRIGVIERATMEIEEIEVFFPRPHAIAVSPGGGRVFTASLAVNQMASLQPRIEEIELVNVPGETHTFVQFAVSPDGTVMVTGGQVSGEIMVFSITDPEAPELIERFHVGGEPWHPVFSPDGERVYFPRRTANSVAVVDTGSWEVVGNIEGPAFAEPHGSAISSDGGVLWISNRNTEGVWEPRTDIGGDTPGTVVAIDTASHKVLEVIEVPPYAAGMATATRR